jgi:hypothetical protein
MSGALGVAALLGPLSASVLGGILLMGMGLAIFAVAARRGPALLRSAGLLLVLTGFFVTFTASLWRLDPERPVVSTIVLLGAVATFRLMAAFEQPPKNPSGRP